MFIFSHSKRELKPYSDISTHLLEWLKLRNKTVTAVAKCWWEHKAAGALSHCRWACRTVQRLWKTVWRFLTKLTSSLPCDPESHSWVFTQVEWKLLFKPKPVRKHFLQLCLKSPQTGNHRNVFHQGDGWTNQCLHAAGHHSAMKRSKLPINLTSWIDLKRLC